MTKLSPQYQAWRARRAEGFTDENFPSPRFTAAIRVAAYWDFLAGAEAEHEAAKLLGRLEALEWAREACDESRELFDEPIGTFRKRLDALLRGGGEG